MKQALGPSLPRTAPLPAEVAALLALGEALLDGLDGELAAGRWLPPWNWPWAWGGRGRRVRRREERALAAVIGELRAVETGGWPALARVVFGLRRRRLSAAAAGD